MPFNQDKLEYILQDFFSRPERVRFAKYTTIVGGIVLASLLVFLLTRGQPPPAPKFKKKTESEQQGPLAIAPSLKSAFEYANDLDPKLRADPRFARVYLVPSGSGSGHNGGKVVIMGEVASDADLHALQVSVASAGVPLPIEWQVAVH